MISTSSLFRGLNAIMSVRHSHIRSNTSSSSIGIISSISYYFYSYYVLFHFTFMSFRRGLTLFGQK